MTSFVSTYTGSAVPIAMTRSELRTALGSGDRHTHVFFIGGSNAGADAVDGLADIEQQCIDENWPQTMIDCMSSLGSDGACTAFHESEGSSNVAVAGPTEAQLAAVTDVSCAAVGSHLLSLATAAMPSEGSDTVTGGVVAALNAQLAAENPIVTVCETQSWPESQRRCLAAVTTPDQAFACR